MVGEEHRGVLLANKTLQCRVRVLGALIPLLMAALVSVPRDLSHKWVVLCQVGVWTVLSRARVDIGVVVAV